MTEPTPTPTPAPAPTPEPTPTKPWYEGVADAEIVGHWQNRGWGQKTAAEIAIEATKSHREAEKLIGAPADQMIRLPKDATDAAGWDAVWQRLGAPKEAKDYDFSAVKTAKGEALPQALADTLRTTAAEAKLTKSAAERVAAAVVKHLDASNTEAAAVNTDKLAKEQETLKQNWGTNYEANKFVAQQAAQKFGITPEEVNALEATIGYARTMDFLRNVGMRIGEGKFVAGGDNALNGGLVTKEQAVARKAELMADGAWAKRYLEGGTQEAREMSALIAIIAG